MKRYVVLVVLVLAAAVVFASGEQSPGSGSDEAQGVEFPSKPITIVVPSKAGGSLDVSARALAAVASPYLNGQPVVIENKPGGSGLIGAQYAATQAADGYTVLNGWGSPSYAFSRYARDDSPVEVITELKPVIGVMTISTAMIVPIDSPFNSVEELAEYAEDHPGELKWTAAGRSGGHYVMALDLFRTLGIEVTEVPNTQGGAEARNLVAGNNVDFGFIATSIAAPLVGDRLRVLAVGYGQRDVLVPEVPTFRELGYQVSEMYEVKMLAVPAATPDSIVQALYEGFKEAMNEPDFQNALRAGNMEILGWSPQECLEFATKVDADMYALLEDLGIAH